MTVTLHVVLLVPGRRKRSNFCHSVIATSHGILSVSLPNVAVSTGAKAHLPFIK